MRPRQVIRRAEANRKRRRLLGRGMRIDLQLFLRKIQPPLELKWPARSAVRQQIPAMHVFDIERAVDMQVRQGPGEVSARRNHPMHADVVAMNQADDVVEAALVQSQIEVERFAWMPRAARDEVSESARGPVRARRLSRELQLPGPVRAQGRNIQIAVRQIENRF